MDTIHPLTVPVCGDCNQNMRCDKNSVLVKDPASGSFRSTFWMGDRYKCSGCSSTVIVGFGRGMVYNNGEEPLDAIEIRYS